MGDRGQTSHPSLGQSTKTHRLVPHSIPLPAALRDVFLEGVPNPHLIDMALEGAQQSQTLPGRHSNPCA